MPEPSHGRTPAPLGGLRYTLLALVFTSFWAAAPCLGLAGCAEHAAWRAQLEAAGIRFISARELKAMLDRREDLVLIDARDEIWYRASHIPGAISIPAEDAPLSAVDVARPKRLLHPERLPADRGRPLVFYCGGPT